MNTSLIFLILIVAVSTTSVMGFNRARPYGRVGVLAWLQSMTIMLPWLLILTFLAFGVVLSFAGILLLLVAATGLYIYLGRQVRAARQDAQQPVPEAHQSASATDDDSDLGPADGDSPEETDAAVADSSPKTGSEPQPAKKATPPQVVPIPNEDLEVIRSIFGIDTFFSTETIPYQNGAVFKGNLRGDPDETYAQLSRRLDEKLGDRYRLFLVEGPDGKPVVITLPGSSDPPDMTPAQKGLAIALAFATLATSMESAGILLGFDFFAEPDRLAQVVPISCGILLTLLAHEVGHRILANRHQVRLSWPFLMPALQIGSFGSITRFASPIPNRQVLFDVAFAGPAVGGLVSLMILVMGLFLSHPGSLFQLPPEFFRGSILVGILAKFTLGSDLQNTLVDVHPLALVGWLGLVITALNLMPAGQLDGGRIVQSIYGRKTTRWSTVITLVILAIASLSTPLALYWAIIILFLQRELERPSLNELTEPNDTRAALGLLALFLMAAILLPLTPSLAGRLGIGG